MQNLLKICIFFLNTILLAASALEARKAMVVADHPRASAAGLKILKQGGNAFDAAIATALALGVVNPHSSGIGGGFVALVYAKETKEIKALDARETAPLGFLLQDYLHQGKLMPDRVKTGALSVAVPQEIRGFLLLHQTFGSLPWSALFEPAIDLAQNGFPILPYFAQILQKHKTTIEQHPLMREIYSVKGQLLQAGDVFKQPKLARTLKTLAKDPESFFTGSIAEDIIKTIASAGGQITARDLALVRPRFVEPLQTSFKQYQIYSMPSPSSGGACLIRLLEMTETFDFGPEDFQKPETIRYLTEAMRLVYRDRARYFGDQRYVTLPEDLFKRGTNQDLARKIKEGYRAPRDFHTPPEDGGTSHLSVIDELGNLVALTTTINTEFGSLLYVMPHQILLNNQMDDFSWQDQPNSFGLIGSTANHPKKGKKPLSSMSPTLIFEQGRPRIAAGGSGGPRIISGVFQTILNSLVFQQDTFDSVNSPRFHHQWFPDVLEIETTMPETSVSPLKEHYQTKTREARNCIQLLEIKDRIKGASDPRKQGYPAGF